MCNKINDLNPKNETFNNYQEKAKSIVSRQAQNLYQDKYFGEEYRAVFISSVGLRFVANIASAATLFIAVFLAANLLLGVYLSFAIGLIFCLFFEILKNYVWKITAKQSLKYKRISTAAVLVLVALHLVSLGGSCFGAWQLPTLLSAPRAEQEKLKDLDKINTSFLSQISAIDKQIEQLQSKTSSSTIRKALNNLTIQRKQTLDAQKTALEYAKKFNNSISLQNQQKTKLAISNHSTKIKQAQINCVGLAVFFELLFIISSIFIAYYLFRQFIDDTEPSESNEQANVKHQENNQESNKKQASKGHQAPVNATVQKIGFVQGENLSQNGKRTELKYTKICALDSCKKPYLHNIHNQKYCSVDCRKIAYEERKSKKQTS